MRAFLSTSSEFYLKKNANGFKIKNDFTEEEKTDNKTEIKLRSQVVEEHFKGLCHHHEQTNLRCYSEDKTQCCDSLCLHKKQAKKRNLKIRSLSQIG